MPAGPGVYAHTYAASTRRADTAIVAHQRSVDVAGELLVCTGLCRCLVGGAFWRVGAPTQHAQNQSIETQNHSMHRVAL
jgi:uncharacterized protein (DUF2461 family)